jgi:crotonobetainyl-CoA:carnitine CoA-transferase CaiB-like acyl-CoA transferase
MRSNGAKPLTDLLVVERAGRLAGSVCGGLLQQLGARVMRFETQDDPEPLALQGDSQANLQAFVRLGKERVRYEPALFTGALDRADIAILAPFQASESTEVAEICKRRQHLIGCIITPFGLEGPAPDMPASGEELLLQAVSGVMATTGEKGGPPLPNGVPLGEMVSGVNGASSVLAALHYKEKGHYGQIADIGIYDSLIGLLGTFLPLVIAGDPTEFRQGCRHPLIAPWNVYPTSDGCVIICTSTDLQWERLLKLIEREDLFGEKKFSGTSARCANVEEVDRIVAAWTRRFSTQQVNRKIEEIGIPVTVVFTVPDLMRNAEFVSRGMVRQVFDEDGGKLTLAGSVLNLGDSPADFADKIEPLQVEVNWHGVPTRAEAHSHKGGTSLPNQAGALPLAGLKVVELGFFTAGPMAARHFSSLGAEVVKVESPGGQPSRKWTPAFDGVSHYFINCNCDKRSLSVDLKQEEGKHIVLRLCAEADVLIENMRPGTMEKLGLGYEDVKQVNPGIIYFSVSGYGSQGSGAGKAAYDTVIQANTGIMSLVNQGNPVKIGVSIADMMGAQFAPLVILAALRDRNNSGLGQHIDMSMQDVTAWLTQLSWPMGTNCLPPWHCLETADGYFLVVAEPERVHQVLAEQKSRHKTSEELLVMIQSAGFHAVRVLELSEVLTGAQVARRRLLPERLNRRGMPVKVLECPLRLDETPGRVRHIIGAAGEDSPAILAELGYRTEDIEALQEQGIIPRPGSQA